MKTFDVTYSKNFDIDDYVERFHGREVTQDQIKYLKCDIVEDFGDSDRIKLTFKAESVEIVDLETNQKGIISYT